MAKYTVEQIISIAKRNYDESEKLLCDLAEALKQTVDSSLNVKDVLVCFDFIIQACLLGASVKDGNFEDAELYFIQNVTKNGDLMKLVNYELSKQFNDWRQLSWNEIKQLDSDTQQKLATTACTLVVPYADKFVNLLATADKCLKENIREMIYNNVGYLFVAIAGIDGDDLNSAVASDEGSYAFYLYEELVEKKWKSITGE